MVSTSSTLFFRNQLSYVLVFLLLLAKIWIGVCKGSGTGTLNYITGNRFQLNIRNAVRSDLKDVAELCSNAFDGPFEWYQFLDKKKSGEGYLQQLSERYKMVTEG